jgi:membrane dipeptidase
MKVIDTHCDVLYKMLLDESLDFTNANQLDVTYNQMKKANILMQCFAIFLPSELSDNQKQTILKAVDLFYLNILKYPDIQLIRSKQDLKSIINQPNKMGALLSLEGVDGLQGDFVLLRTLCRLGLRAVGITWNHANWAADGIGEARAGGFTERGKALVDHCEELELILDVSHLSETAFWELVERASRPFIASHSNAYSICNHPRNLKDDQIKAILSMNGHIGLTFVPQFVKDQDEVSMKDLLHHIDHVCALGGQKHIGFGSDFDGIDRWIRGLENTADYTIFSNLLLKHYDENFVQDLLWRNWFEYYSTWLPN